MLLKKLIYLATALPSLVFVLLLKLRASLLLPVIKVKFLPYLKKLYDCVQEGAGGRHRGSGFEANKLIRQKRVVLTQGQREFGT